jgi:hypothetical protein
MRNRDDRRRTDYGLGVQHESVAVKLYEANPGDSSDGSVRLRKFADRCEITECCKIKRRGYESENI